LRSAHQHAGWPAFVRRGRCDADPGLGYALLDRFLDVAAHRLQATRARLIDVRLHPNAG